jgi:Integrase zinc binding domain/Integrase core domain
MQAKSCKSMNATTHLFCLKSKPPFGGMDHFGTYLRERKFTLVTDHRPLEKLGKVHTKTKNRLQDVMNTYDLTLFTKKEVKMPADNLSRNLANLSTHQEISPGTPRHYNRPKIRPPVKALKSFLLNKELPNDAKCRSLISLFTNDCFIKDDIIWRHIKRQFEPSRVVIFPPAALVPEALSDAHGKLLVGHDGIYKMKKYLLQCFYLPGMDADIAAHLKSCHRCQIRRKDDRPLPALLSTLPQHTEPDQRVHSDLFGPLKMSDSGKKFIFCMTEALAKYVELVPLQNKEVTTVAEAIFDKWIFCFGAPLDLVTDQGKEFCAKMSDNLLNWLGTTHLTTSPHHPQCNSQAEVANKTIAKYLASFCDNSTLD